MSNGNDDHIGARRKQPVAPKSGRHGSHDQWGRVQLHVHNIMISIRTGEIWIIVGAFGWNYHTFGARVLVVSVPTHVDGFDGGVSGRCRGTSGRLTDIRELWNWHRLLSGGGWREGVGRGGEHKGRGAKRDGVGKRGNDGHMISYVVIYIVKWPLITI